MRTGIIITIDTSKGSGVIVDENDQEITFYFTDHDIELEISMKVNFEIELTHLGLVAVQLSVSR